MINRDGLLVNSRTNQFADNQIASLRYCVDQGGMYVLSCIEADSLTV